MGRPNGRGGPTSTYSNESTFTNHTLVGLSVGGRQHRVRLKSRRRRERSVLCLRRVLRRPVTLCFLLFPLEFVLSPLDPRLGTDTD